MRQLTAQAERGTGYWVVEVPEIAGLLTQARRLDQIPAMVKDAAALITGEPEDSFDVRVVPIVDEAIREHLEHASELFAEAARVQHEAAAETRAVARELVGSGMTLRDVGEILGVSHQRAHQLAS